MEKRFKLYNLWISSCSYRVRIALNLKKLDYEYITVDLLDKNSKNFAQNHPELNGLKQLPALFDTTEDLHLTQSLAIIKYIDSINSENKLFPENPVKNAQVLEIVEIMNSGVQPLQNLPLVRMLAEHVDSKKFAHDVCVKGLSAVERIIQDTSGNGHFCVGDGVTAADLFLLPQVGNAVQRFQVDMSEFPGISGIVEHLEGILEVKNAMPRNQVDAPKDLPDFLK